jgi:hypothetical protein
MNCRNNVKKRLDGLLPTHTITSRLSSEKAAPRFTFSKKGSYHSRRISLILLHTFAKCLLALSISTSLGSRKAYRICIQLVTAIVLHPHKTLLRPLPDLWLSLYVKFVPYMNRAFSLVSRRRKVRKYLGIMEEDSWWCRRNCATERRRRWKTRRKRREGGGIIW